jgi:protoporphyrinogen oxidase
MMWERFRDRVVAGGGEVRLGAAVATLEHDGTRVRELHVGGPEGGGRIPCDLVISSMPVTTLAAALEPAAPDEVLEAAGGLRYRAMVVVGLVLARAEAFPDHWIYVHDPEIRVGRIQNFKRWSAAMCSSPEVTNLGLEYFCDEGDATWGLPDEELVVLASTDLERLGLGRTEEVEGGVVFRQARAYPVYDETYRDRLEVIWRHLDRLCNLRSVGRNGLHRYNNLDHSMLTGMQAARDLVGG